MKATHALKECDETFFEGLFPVLRNIALNFTFVPKEFPKNSFALKATIQTARSSLLQIGGATESSVKRPNYSISVSEFFDRDGEAVPLKKFCKVLQKQSLVNTFCLLHLKIKEFAFCKSEILDLSSIA